MISELGPVYREPPDAELLAAAYRSSLALAAEHGLATVALPAISCGVYGYPPRDAAAVSLAVAREPWPLEEIRFVLFSGEMLEIWRRELEGRG